MKHAEASKNLLQAKEILDGLGVPFFLSNGTLLGWAREKQLIDHDTDVDIGVKIQDFHPDIYKRFLESGFELYSEYGTIETGLQYSFMKNGVKLDVFFYYDTPTISWMAVWMKRENIRIKYIYPPIRDYETVEFFGVDFKIPSNWKDYLKAQYGNWEIPVANWSCFDSPKNMLREQL